MHASHSFKRGEPPNDCSPRRSPSSESAASSGASREAVAANDLAAIGVLNRVLEAGLAVPDDMAVVGYDDMPFAGSEALSLTTVHQPIELMATQCIDSLEARIEVPSSTGVRVLLSPHLVARRTTLGSKFGSAAIPSRKAAGPRRRR